MAYSCEHCSQKLVQYLLVGAYVVPPDDDGKYVSTLQWDAAFKPIAMISCPTCGAISFMEVQAAQKQGLTRAPLEEPITDRDTEEELKEQLRQSDIFLENLSARVKNLDEEN